MARVRPLMLAAAALALGACGELETNDVVVSQAPTEPAADVVAAAASTESLGTFLAALFAADLDEPLRTGGPFTVFAPTDEAFAALPPGTLDDLLRPENAAQLRSILSVHVVQGRLFVSDLDERTRIASDPTAPPNPVLTLGGRPLVITRGPDDGLMIGRAKIVTPNVVANNGVLHTIDAVLLPQEDTLY